jgi:hypothetical protein
VDLSAAEDQPTEMSSAGPTATFLPAAPHGEAQARQRAASSGEAQARQRAALNIVAIVAVVLLLIAGLAWLRR